MLHPICSTDFYPLHQMNAVSLLESHQNIGYLLVMSKSPENGSNKVLFYVFLVNEVLYN